MRGGAFPTSFLLILLLLLLVMWPSQAMSATVMDGLAEWKGPVVQVGDSFVFRHKHHLQNLYLFHNRRAFDLCSFSQATLIYDGSKSTHFTWHPARPGFYYFSTRNSSGRRCEEGEKLLVRVITPDPSTGFPPTVFAPFPIALPPTAGGDLPSHGWAIGSPSSSPTPAPEAASPSSSGPLLPRNGHAPSDAPMPHSGGGIPFISSNPAVPLPSDETDSATILPLPSPGDRNRVAGQGSTLRVGTSWLMLVMMAFFGTCV
ncbi:uncharacterized protein [Elaeis guineensis]|uniref:Early nodulin-20 n=1 Tax=Elaeis guineensis var. tenera TaxID=51953 RepID=A0A6I9QS43_ELAGV|nr:early nodulin-20 [Elaeis guineensis]